MDAWETKETSKKQIECRLPRGYSSVVSSIRLEMEERKAILMLPGIGLPELIVVLIVGLLAFGVPIAVAIWLFVMIRNQGCRVAALEADNERLRRQLDKA